MREVLENNAGHRAPLIKQMHWRPSQTPTRLLTKQYWKIRKVARGEVRGNLGERLANSIANAFKPNHIKEYRENRPQTKEEAPPPPSKEDHNAKNAINKLIKHCFY